MHPPVGSRSALPLSFDQIVVGGAGLFYLLSGAALLLAPAWFYLTIGTFPPFNRHYAGDLGAFLLPLGAALLIAARSPSRHGLLIACAAGGSLLHACNHIYDAIVGRAAPGDWLVDIPSLLLIAVLLIVVYRFAHRSSTTRHVTSG